jgi:hypothetical protein
MAHVTVAPEAKSRGAVFYARLKDENHTWLHAEAKRNGFKTAAEFHDALITKLRTGGKVAAKTMKVVKKAKKAVKRAGKKK